MNEWGQVETNSSYVVHMVSLHFVWGAMCVSRLTQDLSSSTLQLGFLRKGLSLNLEFTDLARLADH